MTPVLIGRNHPASVLRSEIVRATESHGGLVLVTGEAGIGKTSLVTDAADEARRLGALVLGGSCWDSDSAPGYWPWVQVVRGLRRGLGEEWPQAEKAAGGLLSVLLGEDPGLSRENTESFPLYDAVTTALVTASQKRPLVVVIDDLHWADAASLKLLEFAAQHAWFERIVLICTYRDAEVESADHPLQELILPLAARASATVTLTGLARDEVGALIALTSGVEPDPGVVDEVHRRTGGNPFFVEQTVRIWRSGSPVSTVAPGVREAVRRRLTLLPEPVSGLLETAAVLGRQFHRQVLAAVAGAPVPQVDRLLARATAARLVTARTGGRFAFVHDLVRETLYEALDDGRRRILHAGVVRAMDGSDAVPEGRILPAELARHAYLAGGELERGHRVDLLAAAGTNASGRLAGEEAIGHFRRAAEAAGDDARRAALINLDLGREFWQGGDEESSWRAFDRAVTLAAEVRDPALTARVAITIHHHGLGALDENRGIGLLREAHRAMFGGGEADPAGLSAERMAEELAVSAAELARTGADDDALAFSLWARHDTIWGLGTSRERLGLTSEMIEVAQRTGNTDMELHASSMRWVTLLELGDPRYLEQLRAFGALAGRSGLRRHELAVKVDQSLVAGLNGRFAEAAELLSAAAELHSGISLFDYMIAHMRWSSLLLQGRFEEARETIGSPGGAAHPYPALLSGITAAEQGDLHTAGLCAAEMAALPAPASRVFAPLAIRLRAQVAAASGDPALIAESRAELAPYAGRWLVSLFGCDIGGPVDLWLGLLEAARGDLDAAAVRLTAARESADRLRARPWSLRVAAELLAVLHRGGRAPGTPADSAGRLAEEIQRESAELGLTHLPAIPGAAPGEAAAEAPRTAGAAGSDITGAPAVPAGPLGDGGTASGAGGASGPGPARAGARGSGGKHSPARRASPARAGSARHGGAEIPGGGGSGAGGSETYSDGAGGGGARAAVAPLPERQFRRTGAVWALTFGGRTVHVPDAKGLRDLHALVARAGEDLSAVSLLAPEGGATVLAARGLGGDPVLDEAAKASYRRRLERLDEELDRAAELGDTGRTEEFGRERAALLEELRAAAGLGGRTRRLGDEAERARKTVTARIRDTLRKLTVLHPELAAHLTDSVTTGAHCSYRPGAPAKWRL